MPLGGSSFELPDYRKQSLVNQFTQWPGEGFSGRHAVYYEKPGPLGLSRLVYYCWVP